MSIYIVKNLDNSGIGSLRDGIIFANANPNTEITFDANLSGKIKLKNSLPKILNPTNIIGNLVNGLPTISISSNCESIIFELYKTSNCNIEKLCLTKSSCGIFFNETSYSFVNDCLIGINNQNNIKSNKYGIIMKKSHKNIIGSNPSNSEEYFSNTISGNEKAGIYMIESSNNIIQNNIIGLSSYCDKKIGNYDGIKLNSSENNTIGGKIFINNSDEANNPTGTKGTVTPVFVRPLLGNIISGNLNDGILFFNNSNYNNILGNFVGVGNKNLINFGNHNHGIHIMGSNFNLLGGCDIDTNPFIFYNVIGWNKKNGILIDSSDYTTIQGNFIGCNYDNLNPAPNFNGLVVSGTSKFTVVGGPIPLGNVISGNLNNGIYLTDKIHGFDSINTFCGIVAFGGALGNNNGITIDSNASLIRLNTNVISGNYENGINIKGNSNKIIITSNIIGLSTNGNTPIPNYKTGIVFSENAYNIIDGANVPSVIFQNTISSNGEYGIIFKDNVKNVRLFNTVIGLNIIKTLPSSNGLGGILIKDNVNKCLIGSIENFNYFYDKNFAMKLTKKTYDNLVTYNFINVNLELKYFPSKNNIINNSKKNKVYANNLPYFN